VAQDFWASSGFRLLSRTPEGWLAPTEAWFARFAQRDELRPPDDAGRHERALHARLMARPLLVVKPEDVAAVEDDDARENWREYLKFRDRLRALGSIEACYLDLFRRPAVDLAPPFVDELARATVRGLLDGTEDAWLCRAGEFFFRLQRVSAEGGQVLAADAATIEAYAETGGFGNVGRLIKAQNTPLPSVTMDILNRENAPFYFLRDELYGFVLDLTPGREGARALARVLERWIAHFAGVAVTIEPVERIADERWRWHAGLDVEATAILNALYEGEPVTDEDRARLVALFRLTFTDPGDCLPDAAGRPVYLGLAHRADHTLRMKPQNLLTNLPFARAE
jgi:Family of unknown function (DUF6352)